MPPEAAGNMPPVDEEGYLTDPADWSESVAVELSRRENVPLTDVHWAVIRFMREYYELHRIAPDARFVLRFLAESRGAERNELFRLFPYGYVKQACKIAGMRKPRAWSTG
jgi:TusE/DsrC/DsvC family sulfur relay protein